MNSHSRLLSAVTMGIFTLLIFATVYSIIALIAIGRQTANNANALSQLNATKAITANIRVTDYCTESKRQFAALNTWTRSLQVEDKRHVAHLKAVQVKRPPALRQALEYDIQHTRHRIRIFDEYIRSIRIFPSCGDANRTQLGKHYLAPRRK